MAFPVLVDDRLRAVEADVLAIGLVIRRGAGRSAGQRGSAARSTRARKLAARGASGSRGQRAHVVLAVERAVARRHAAVVVHDRDRPQGRARHFARLDAEVPLAAHVPVRSGDGALEDEQVHAQLDGERADRVTVGDVVGEHVKLPVEDGGSASRGGCFAAAMRRQLCEHGLEIAAHAVALVGRLAGAVDRHRERRGRSRGDQAFGARRRRSGRLKLVLSLVGDAARRRLGDHRIDVRAGISGSPQLKASTSKKVVAQLVEQRAVQLHRHGRAGAAAGRRRR